VRADRFVIAFAAALALAPAASADPGDEPHAAPVPAAPAAAPATTDPIAAVRDLARRQLADETTAVERAEAQVTDKLAIADRTRLARLRAAYRALAPTGNDAMALARVRAAARVLVDRDAHERGLLDEEAGQLRAAHDRIAREATQVDHLAPPDPLARPVAGKIVRRFGLVEHERAKATLARRGIDFEVDDHAAAFAPAAGTVRYAGPIRGLDHGVILDHGAYLTVIAKLGELALPVGAPIAAGDRLGRAARHRVYFEVRLKLGPGGLPIDPEPLLAKTR
jgi:septal ring factor EnvC (AmiA/AmiB activator)